MKARAPFITLSGIDERTDISVLANLDAEVGILYTATPEGRNRYPGRDWIKKAAGLLPRVAIHVCGSGARAELLAGGMMDLVAKAQRIQVNGALTIADAEKICRMFPDHEIITQFNHSNAPLVGVTAENHAMLLDSSGGRGIAPQAWFRPDTAKSFGFAGGLGPANLTSELPRIFSVAGSSWWVDMEGNLREDDWFSIRRAFDAVCLFHSFLADRDPSGKVSLTSASTL